MSVNDELERIYRRWKRCKKCGLAEFRRTVVPGDGDAHPLLMFVGEGPGKSENLRGLPFIGPAGRVLRKAILDASELAELDRRYRKYYFTNVVACRPTEGKYEPNRVPSKDEAWLCMQRLVELEEVLKPTMVILLGNVPAKLAGHLFPGAGRLAHPSSLARSGGTEAVGYRGYVRDMAEHMKEAVKTRRRRSR